MKWLSRVKNFSVYSVGQAVNLISPLLISPYIIGISGETGFGKIGICMSICLILMGIIDYSSYLQGTKLISINRDNKEYLSNTISSIYSYKIMILIILLIPSILIPILFFSDYKDVFLLSISLLIGHTLNPNWILYGLERYTSTAIYNIISKTIYVISVFVFIKSPHDYIWVNFLNGFIAVLVYTYAFYMLYKEFGLEFKQSNIINGIEILRKDFRISLSEFCLSIYQFFPIVIIGAFTGAYYAGIFRIVEQIYGVLRTFIFLFFNFSYPTVCAKVHVGIKKGLKFWAQYHIINFFIVLLLSLMIGVFSKEILTFFNVNQVDFNFVQNLLYLSLLFPALVVISQAFRQLTLALDLMKWYTKIVYLFTFMNLILLTILIPIFNIKGAFYAMITCELVVVITYFFHIKNYIKHRL